MKEEQKQVTIDIAQCTIFLQENCLPTDSNDRNGEDQLELPMMQILEDISARSEDEHTDEVGKKEKKGLIKLRIGKKSDNDEPDQDMRKRMGMTSASIRFMEPNKLKHVLAIRSLLREMESLIQDKKVEPNLFKLGKYAAILGKV